MSERELRLVNGGDARVIETDGDRVVLDSSRAFPPGSTLEGVLELGALRVKVRGSTRTGERYRVEGRFVNLSRELREALLAG